jgi:cation transport ATPase
MNEKDILDQLLDTYSTVDAAVPQKTEEQKEDALLDATLDAVLSKEDIASTTPEIGGEFEVLVEPETLEEIEILEETEQPEILEEPEITEETEILEELEIFEESEITEKMVETEQDQELPPIRVAPLEEPTQVISLTDEKKPSPKEDFEGQMTLMDFAGEEEPEWEEEGGETEEETSWEEQLELTRQEKIREFKIQQDRENLDFRYDQTEAPDEIAAGEQEAETPPAGRTHFTGDFTDFSQTEDVKAELDYRYRSMRFRLGLAFVAELLLLWSDFTVAFYGQPTVAPSLFLLVNCVGILVMAALLLPMLRDGLSALIRLKPKADSVPTVITAAALLHTLLQWFNLPAVETGDTRLLTALAGGMLLLCGLGKLLKISRIRRNFTVVAKQREKFAVTMIQDERTAIEIGRRAVATGVPRVAYYCPVSFMDDFIANSYMDDRCDGVMQRYIPIASAAALVIGIIAGAVAGSFWTGLSGFAASLAVILPAASVALNLPLWKECGKQMEKGNMLCGFAAAERFGNVHGVALDVSDVYLQDSVALHGIRTFGDARIDEVIMDAAAVAICTEGPLAGLFRRVIEDKTEILQPVENLVFEQDMGFSGWVGGRRVLVGNRKLLDNHGVDTPSGDYERKYKAGGRELVYLSVAGELSAMFIISYVTDPAVKEALQQLQQSGVSMLIRSCDPNVTEESLCSGFELDDYYVDLLTAAAGRLYDNLRHGDQDRVSAGAAVNGTVEGLAFLLTGCRRLRRRGVAAMIAQFVLCAIAFILCFSNAVVGLVPVTSVLLAFAAASAAISAIISLLRI